MSDSGTSMIHKATTRQRSTLELLSTVSSVELVKVKERRLDIIEIVSVFLDERSLMLNQRRMDDLYRWDKSNILNVALKSLQIIDEKVR